MAIWARNIQWHFWVGWSNSFDLIRVALEWESYDTARVHLAVAGVELIISFRAYSYYDLKRKFQAWWYPCEDCGGRFGRHDESKFHPPF